MYRHINDRGNLQAVVCIYPKGHPKHPEGRQVTLAEDLQENEGMIRRSDVVLLNDCRSGKEYCLYVTMQGFGGSTWILDILTDQEYATVLDIAQRMRQNAQDFPPAMRLVRG